MSSMLLTAKPSLTAERQDGASNDLWTQSHVSSWEAVQQCVRWTIVHSML